MMGLSLAKVTPTGGVSVSIAVPLFVSLPHLPGGRCIFDRDVAISADSALDIGCR